MVKKWLLICAGFLVQSTVFGMELSISIDENKHHQTNDVIVNVTLTNESKERVLTSGLLCPECGDLQFVVTDIHGKPLTYSGAMYDRNESPLDLVWLDPSVFYGKPIHLKDYFHLFPGQYKVQAIYTSRDVIYSLERGFRTALWTGKIKSNDIQFTITESKPT